MKKIISCTLVVTLLLSIAVMFSACSTKTPANNGETTTEPAQKATVNILTLKGPTGMGMAKLISDDNAGTTANDYNFTISANTDDIAAAVTNKSSDIIACPLNMASVLYNKTQGQIQMLAVNTLGVLYVLENGNTINSVKDLKGKTIYCSGQGATPEYVLNYILEKNGIDPTKDVKIEWKSEHSELATAVTSNTVKIAVLPEPNVSAVLSANQDVRIALNLTEEFEKVAGDVKLAMGCIIARKEFVDANKEAVNKFLDEYKASAEYVVNNVDAAAQLIVDSGIIPKLPIAKKAIPNCNIVFIEGEEMKKITNANLKVLFDANNKSVGGKLPDDSFFYTR
ncbi:MAG: ABC transporter substrate-binding protein [Clostridiales bacterium]|nr:ABC transporter substrate-binding protein [Clostridiales bacterium]